MPGVVRRLLSAFRSKPRGEVSRAMASTEQVPPVSSEATDVEGGSRPAGTTGAAVDPLSPGRTSPRELTTSSVGPLLASPKEGHVGASRLQESEPLLDCGDPCQSVDSFSAWLAGLPKRTLYIGAAALLAFVLVSILLASVTFRHAAAVEGEASTKVGAPGGGVNKTAVAQGHGNKAAVVASNHSSATTSTTRGATTTTAMTTKKATTEKRTTTTERPTTTTTPKKPTTTEKKIVHKKTHAPKGHGGCSWTNHNCIHTKCCNAPHHECYKRNAHEAFCWPTCHKHKGEPCEKIGGARDPHIKSVPHGHKTSGYSLFCFSVVTVGINHEKDLVNLARQHRLGIFACDEARTYDGVVTGKGQWGSFKNVNIFRHVWDQVRHEGLYHFHDWTVKADLDTVLFPDRLRGHLQRLRPPPDEAIFIRNINFAFKFQGALEILSRDAVELLLRESEACFHHIGDEGGEDGFVRDCLTSSGSGYMTDFNMLYDKYSLDPGWNPDDIDPCTNQHVAALHPFKESYSWLACWKVVVGQQQPSDFVSCANRWSGDACSKSGWRSHPNYDLNLGIVEYH